MKFLCDTEFIDSGKRSYFAGVVYSDIIEKDAERMISMDKKKPMGALSFFTPVDEEAVNFMKTVKRNAGYINEKTVTPKEQQVGRTPKVQTRADLIAEAKNLGIKGADRMTAEELKEVITAKIAEILPPETNGADTSQ